MTTLGSTLVPLATASDSPAVDSLAKTFRGDQLTVDAGSTGGEIAFFIIVGLVLTGLVYFAWRQWQEQRKRRPMSLFVELCNAHDLTHPERKLLRNLAHSAGLADPARLFLEPERFVRESVPIRLADQSDAVRALSERLFQNPVIAVAIDAVSHQPPALPAEG